MYDLQSSVSSQLSQSVMSSRLQQLKETINNQTYLNKAVDSLAEDLTFNLIKSKLKRKLCKKLFTN